jgi:phage-related protein
VPGPLTEGKATDTLHADVQVTLEGKEDAWVVQPGDIAVLGVSQASNGRVYYLDGVVGY